MTIGPDFERASALQCRVRGLERRVRELESGGAYAKLEKSRASAERRHAAQVKRLEAELGDAERRIRRMRENWFDVFGQVERERDEAVRHAQASVRRMEERALRAERQRDEYAGRLTEAGREIREKDARIEELEGQIAKLTAQAARDFENSSIPSSAQGPARKGIPNTREPSGRRPGAQPGHPHHPRKRPEPTGRVELPDPPGFADDPDLYRTGSSVSKIVVSARIAVEAVEYTAAVWRRRSNGARVHAPFPEGAKDEVNYDGTVKALAFMLTTECCASAAKAGRVLREASAGRLGLSDGFVKGLAAEFSAKSAPEREAAVAALMSAPVMHADFTCANVDGKGGQVLILANGSASMMIARESKGHKGIAGTPLEGYAGCVEHDHDTTFYSYGTSHQECMQHNIRYLVGSMQNEPHLSWNKEMLALIREMLHRRHGLAPGEPMDEAAVRDFGARYDAVIEKGFLEYERHPPSKYYRDGCNLLKRLCEYRESELRFLSDPLVDPDNSLCERLARVFKRKQRQAIAFRSFEFLGYVCDSMATINNMRTAGKDVFAESSAIFDRPMPAKAAADGCLPAG